LPIKIKRNSLQNEKIFANYIFDVAFLTRLYRELKKQTLQGINKPSTKLANELNRQFSKEEIQVATKYLKKCSIS
jgi:hypothetical protein